MKRLLQLLVLICAVGTAASFQVEAQPLRPPEPIVVQIGEIDREFIHAWTPPPRREVNSFLFFIKEERAFVSFQFLRKTEQEVNALVQDGMCTKRPVHIMEGERLISSGQLAAPISVRHGARTRHGFILLFDSVEEGRHAANAIGEDLPTILEKAYSRGSWRI